MSDEIKQLIETITIAWWENRLDSVEYAREMQRAFPSILGEFRDTEIAAIVWDCRYQWEMAKFR